MDDEGKLADHHASLAKAFCTAKSRETVSWGRELLGGNGIVADYNVARFFADAEALYSVRRHVSDAESDRRQSHYRAWRLRVSKGGPGVFLPPWPAPLLKQEIHYGFGIRRA